MPEFILSDIALLKAYVATWEALDERETYVGEPIAWEFASGDFNDRGYKQWLPLEFQTDSSSLALLYESLPARLPPLYEQLVLSYRWAGVDLVDYRLLANPFSSGLGGLLSQMQMDKGLWNELVPNGYLQFGKAPDMNYDPICFDFRHRQSDGDCRVVQIDHEEILCNFRIREVNELSSSFRNLVARTLARVSQAE